MKVAFLAFTGPFSQRKTKRTDLLAFRHMGVFMLMDVLRSRGIEAAICTPLEVANFDVVLVSLTSTMDLFNYLWTCLQNERLFHEDFRKCTIIVGGTGCQSMAPLCNYFDAVYYGRAEDDIVGLVNGMHRDGEFDSDHVLYPDGLDKPASINLGTRMYREPINCYPKKIREGGYGCIWKCAYCQYAHTRATWGIADGVFGQSESGTTARYCLFRDLLKYQGERQYVCSLDGFSERIRFAWGGSKKITGEDVARTLSDLTPDESIVVRISMIGDAPTETDADIEEFKRTLLEVRRKARVVIQLQVFPFQPMPWTPAQWMPYTMRSDWRDVAGQAFVDTPHVRAWFSKRCISRLYGLAYMVGARATKGSDALCRYLVGNEYHSHHCGRREKELRLTEKFDLLPFTKGYETTNAIPTVNIKGVFTNETLALKAKELKAKLEDRQESTVSTL